MLQNTAILKVGGGLVAIGGTAGAGYFAHTQGLFTQTETSENTSAKDYLIVRSTTHTSTADGEIYNYALFSAPKKNFQCVTTVATEIIDEGCEIYKLSDDEKSLAKAISNNVGANSTNIKEANNYFKITSPKLIDAINKWEHATEQLIQITQKDKTKIFAKLTPVYKVKNGEIVARKTSFLYAKVKDTVGTSVSQPTTPALDTSNKNYQCQLATEKFDCTIIELTIDSNKKVTPPTDTSSLTSANLKIKDKHFRIEMEEKYIKKLKYTDTQQTIDLIQKTNIEDGKHYAKLTPLFHKIDQDIFSSENFWLLAKPTETASETKNNYTDCKIGTSTTKVKCELYKFASDQGNISSINFSGNLTKTNASNEIKNTTHLVIKFENNLAVINDLKPDLKIILSSTDATTKKEYTLTLKKRLFVDSSTTGDTLTINSVHVLDE